jgi:hypothetical protein
MDLHQELGAHADGSSRLMLAAHDEHLMSS